MLVNEAVTHKQSTVKHQARSSTRGESELHTETVTQVTAGPSAESHEKVAATTPKFAQLPAHHTSNDAGKSAGHDSMPEQVQALNSYHKSTSTRLPSTAGSAALRHSPRSVVSAVQGSGRLPSPGRDRARRRDQSPLSSSSSDGGRDGSARRCRSRPLAVRKRRKRSF